MAEVVRGKNSITLGLFLAPEADGAIRESVLRDRAQALSAGTVGGQGEPKRCPYTKEEACPVLILHKPH